jgi:hypothetical protein
MSVRGIGGVVVARGRRGRWVVAAVVEVAVEGGGEDGVWRMRET